MNTLDRVRQLSNVTRVNRIDDVMVAIESWEKKFADYVEKTGHSMPEVWKTNAIMDIIPLKHKEEIEVRYAGKDTIDYEELRMHIQNWAMTSTRGRAPMAVDSTEREAEWDEWYQSAYDQEEYEEDEGADTLQPKGKGKSAKNGKGGKKGKGKGGKGKTGKGKGSGKSGKSGKRKMIGNCWKCH